MSDTLAGLLQVTFLVAALAICYRPLGAYMARVYEGDHDTRLERAVYRVIGVDPKADQRWPVYARALLAFSAVSVLFLYALLRFQPHLPLSLGFPGVAPAQAFNTAASFVTNTNWQSYSGESTMGHLVQMSGLAMSLSTPKESILNPGPHGLSEVFYAFMSAANNNGSAFAGISVNTGFYNTALGLVMLAGRFIPIVLVLALAGSLARQTPVPATAGTLPTHRPLFVGLLVGVVIIVAGLTFFPALALGPLAEGL